MSSTPFEISVSVMPGDIDEQNHVNNTVYLRWVQEIATAHWQAIASSEAQEGVGWVVLRHEIDYKTPACLGDDVVLLPTPMTEGTRAIRVSKKDDQLAAEELWTSKHMKPDFTELIAHKGYLYGIDGSMFS